jgi:hypothetical protein
VVYDRESLVRPHPSVEMVVDADPAGGTTMHAYNTPRFRVREGVTEMRFGSWPRIDDAIASYAVFHDLREQGVIPAHLRFQVCLPFPSSVVNASFKVAFEHDYAIAAPALQEMMVREVGRLLEAVPPADLALQWDVCYEVLELEGVVPWSSGDAWEHFAGPLPRLASSIPDEVLMGYHLCYGTSGGWPMFEPRDMALLVRMANHATQESGRKVDWFHLAGPRYLRSEEERFFSPLGDLRVGDARVFLGIVLPIDGVSGLKRRSSTASLFLGDFGIAMYCGFGRQPGQNGMETMLEHHDTVRAGLGLQSRYDVALGLFGDGALGG